MLGSFHFNSEMTFEGRNKTIEGTKQGKYAYKIVCNLNGMVKVKDKGIVTDVCEKKSAVCNKYIQFSC
jgi:hypothetical protein